jgi:hypothetical protein
MLLRKSVIVMAAVFVVFVPLALFTDVLGIIPDIGAVLTSSFWRGQPTELETIGSSAIAVALAGPACILMFLFWHLWIQRYKEELVLVTVAKASDIHRWLKEWAEFPKEEVPDDLRAVATKARRVFKRLDRLVSLGYRENWRPSYGLYLAFFYFSHAHELSAFQDVKVDPPVESWPGPDRADRLNARRLDLVDNAVEFSQSFTNGAKAWTGLQIIMHTVVGTATLLVGALLLGGGFGLGLFYVLGSWAGPVLASLMCASIAGMVAGYVWYRVSLLMRRKAPAEQSPAGSAYAAPRTGISSASRPVAAVDQSASGLGKG